MLDQLYRLGNLVRGGTCFSPSQSSYHSFSTTKNGSSRRHFHFHNQHYHHHYHHHLLKLILLSIALTGGCLCYLTIYYQLTTLVATETEPNQIINQSTAQQSHSFLVSSNLPTSSSSSSLIILSSAEKSPITNSSGNDDHHRQTIVNTLQLDTFNSDDSINNQISNNNNFWAANANEITVKEILVEENNNNHNHEEVSLKQQHQNDHVSEYLSEHVQLLAVKAAHRLEMLLHEVDLIITEINKKQFSVDSCPQVSVFFADIFDSSFFNNKSDDIFNFSLLPPFYKSQLPSAQNTSTVLSTIIPITISLFSPCDVLLLFADQQNGKINNAQKMKPAKLSPLEFQQKIKMFLPNRASVNNFLFFENFVSTKTKLCTLFKIIQSFSVFDNSSLLLQQNFCDTSTTAVDINVHKLKNLDIQLPLSDDKSIFSEVILVTSLNPLRAFIYKERKQNQNHNLSTHMKKQIKLTLLTTLVLLDIAEQILPENDKEEKVIPVTTTTTTHFHLLTFNFEVSNSKEKIILLNVTNYQLSNLSNFENNTFFLPSHKYILNDVLKLLCSATPNELIVKLKSQLERLLRSDELGLQGVNCHQSHRVCLSTDDFQYLLDTLAQAAVGTSKNDNRNEFQLLYPRLNLQNDDNEEFLNNHLEKLFEKILLFLADRQKQKTVEVEYEQPNEFLLLSKTSGFEYLTERMFTVLSLLEGVKFASTSKVSTENNSQFQIINDHQNKTEKDDNYHQHDTGGIYDLTNLNSMYHSSKVAATDHLTPPFDSPSSSQKQNTLSNCIANRELLSTLSKFSVLLPLYISLDLLLPKPLSSEETAKNFNPHHYETQNQNSPHYHYQASGPANYRDLLFSLDIAVAHCDVWIKLEDRVLFQFGILNFTLGLGENVITFSLVTRLEDKKDYQVITTYTITIHRLSREELYYSPMPPKIQTDNKNLLPSKEVCSLKQDCEMAVFGDSEPCGLQRTGLSIATYGKDILTENIDYQNKQDNRLKSCADGAASGHWLVPCYSCDQESTCSWTAIQWKPTTCQYQIPVHSDRLKSCFETKRHLLIIGDSTSRGIMNYIVERLNGTLTEADKTHNWKEYRLTLKANNEPISESFEVTVTFVYYPKFWIPFQKRPSFANVLHQLLEKIVSLNNKTSHLKEGEDLTIVVGGVQWIAQKHLLILQEQIKLFNIFKTRIVIKSLGSGFHQPVNGVHYMPLFEQKKLAVHNAELIETARKMNFGIVDTFNKTIALYRDFYPGKCACHFHKIINKPSQKQQTYQPKQSLDFQANSQQKLQHFYHVDGHLNRLYSEILLLEMCK